jgi:hypothetical protein
LLTGNAGADGKEDAICQPGAQIQMARGLPFVQREERVRGNPPYRALFICIIYCNFGKFVLICII